MSIDPSNWEIKLPIYRPEAVLDFSTVSEYARCPRRGFYRYGLRRGFEGKSWPIQYGLAYHKYREVVENLMREKECGMTNEIHDAGQEAALDGWENPPLGHRHEYLDEIRLVVALKYAMGRIKAEQESGKIQVTRAEDSFDLELPFYLCSECGHAQLEITPGVEISDAACNNCARIGTLYLPRHGGRVDQFVKFSTLGDENLIRDFKTTSRMGKYYEQKFDPNGQIQGYVWAGQNLSGRNFNGALVETVYNTKTKGPEITQHYVSFSRGQQEAWEASMMMERSFIQMMFARVDELGYLAFPQRTNACTDFGGCPFRDACRSGSGYEVEKWLENYTIYSHWDFVEPDLEEAQV